jgi:heat shock protein HtpX
MKRIMLLVATNLAIMLVLGIVSTLTGANRFFAGSGLDLGRLLFFALIMGFGGAFISLLVSKTIAKWSTGARVIESPGNSTEFWLVETVRRFADRPACRCPRWRSTRVSRMRSPLAPVATARWSPSPPACCRA